MYIFFKDVGICATFCVSGMEDRIQGRRKEYYHNHYSSHVECVTTSSEKQGFGESQVYID